MTDRLWALGGTLCSVAGRRVVALGLMATLFALVFAGHSMAADAHVVVTIKPIHSLVTRVMEGVGTPLLLVDGKASPHVFSLRPSQVQAISKADVFIRVSERLEPFTAKVAGALPNGAELISLVDAPGVKLLEQRSNGAFDDHGHEGDDHGRSATSGSADSHIWLDPDNAKAIATYIAGALSARFPQHAATFNANATRLNADIDALTSELAKATAPLRDKPFVVFHDAYQYFDRRFELDAVGSITVSPEVQPSARRLIELRDRIRALKATCVFAEPLFQPRLVAVLTEGTDARAGVLDPEGLSLDAGPDLYFALMRNLAGSLKACLSPAS
jgi:zinc transport system substrate-binding protein